MSSAKPKVTRKRRPDTLQTGTASKAGPNVLRGRLKPNQTPEASKAEYMVEGLAMNALVGLAFASKLGELDLTECFAQLLTNARCTASGDRASQESILAAQVISTNAIYTELALIARTNLTHSLDIAERLLRLALKAQSNCRATAEALALMQNPPAVFAKQANISNGPQQVNNGVPQPKRVARTKNLDSRPNKLLEANGERLDGGTTGAPSDRNQELATVGPCDWPAKPRRQGAIRATPGREGGVRYGEHSASS